MSMGPPLTVVDAGQTPVGACETPISQVVRGLDTDGGISSSLLMEAAQGMEGTPSRPVRSTGYVVHFPRLQDMDVELDVNRRDREERERALALTQSCPMTQDIRASLDVAHALETGVAPVASTDLRDTCGAGEGTHGVEDVEEGGAPWPAQGDGVGCRPGLHPIRGEDDDAEGGGDGAVGGGDAPRGGSDAVTQHDTGADDRQTSGGGDHEDAGGDRDSNAGIMQRCADDGRGEKPADAVVVGRPDALVEGVRVLPLGGAMSIAVLECDGRNDPLAADRRGQMEDASMRVLEDPSPYAPCSPSVPSSMTGFNPPPWDSVEQMESIKAACVANTRSWDSGRGGSESRSCGRGTRQSEGKGLDSLSPQSWMKTRPHGLGSVRKVTKVM
ncbi:hypothetical protein CBR_g11145 [Chara braunii]|uniref:Uncharacterized protein n=1 Tax=Chara braunii TaxID=69332 RepID=A0A388KQK6_CHABU|nr:hypothetical protein CBR_g11145 [Chara braunii]|eukprot:GBG72213.1 hypothetical protein CBR_g11145 [Chara braunii]